MDKFRIKIWDRPSGTTVCDNQKGDADNTAPNTDIEGGAIVIQ